MSERYRLRIARPAARALAEVLPEKVATAAYEFITGPLLDNPHRVGKPLEPPLAPAWTARRGTYRILYFLDDAHRVVEVTAIRHRSDAYRT
ncbi:type II toxin-antitoxin system RelE family toxin [Leekyejoonella antrihumi]|uniref:type II toxin-antitoxin system RelE family toxin n=1 Tax=Leekyejoonella antrihumi TaxID=1660198 RepID=UPI001C94123B|nr:type II toxin-antitoxin system RelE/ParE family toxin [Leekyejoonella antrihumi]